MSKLIQLSNTDQSAIVDDHVFEFLSQWTWSIDTHGYARRVVKHNGKMHLVLMHRLITGAVPGQQVDHIDRNRLNNQRSNLRFVTGSQNQINTAVNAKKNATTTSRYKGVYRRPDRPGWRAVIERERRKYHLGVFAEEREAALAYNRKALELFGEHAVLNSVEEGAAT